MSGTDKRTQVVREVELQFYDRTPLRDLARSRHLVIWAGEGVTVSSDSPLAPGTWRYEVDGTDLTPWVTGAEVKYHQGGPRGTLRLELAPGAPRVRSEYSTGDGGREDAQNN